MHMQHRPSHNTSEHAPCNRMRPVYQLCQAKSAAHSMQHNRAACSSSSSSSSSRKVCAQQARRAPSVATAASSTHTSSGSGRQASGIISHFRRLLGVVYKPCEAPEVESVLTELGSVTDAARHGQWQMLPGMQDVPPDITLRTHPKLFKQSLEAAIEHSVLLSEPDLHAKGRVIDGVVLALQQSSRAGALQLNSQRVRIDRIAVVGSAGKNVSVQGQFDVDLVAFVNLPAGVQVDLCDPDTCLQNGSWMMQLQAQLVLLLHQELACSPGLPLLHVRQPRPGSAAVKFAVAGQIPESKQHFELDCDLVLAPNLDTGAGAAAAAEYGVAHCERDTVAETQRQAVLAPVLQLADGVRPAYLRSVWLAEASTEFVKQAAGSAALQAAGLSGRVVTSTIRLVKAWVRKGLQPQYVSGLVVRN